MKHRSSTLWGITSRKKLAPGRGIRDHTPLPGSTPGFVVNLSRNGLYLVPEQSQLTLLMWKPSKGAKRYAIAQSKWPGSYRRFRRKKIHHSSHVRMTMVSRNCLKTRIIYIKPTWRCHRPVCIPPWYPLSEPARLANVGFSVQPKCLEVRSIMWSYHL
jgi:hypothetical protein